MDLPRSSLLSTLQQFLPEIEEANRKTARLAADGKLDVLDSNLEVASSGGGECDNSVRDETDGEDDEEGSAGEHREETNEERTDGRTVQLDFALGDFEDTPIADMEREKDEAATECIVHEGRENGRKLEDVSNVDIGISSQQKKTPLVQEM